MNKNTSNLRRKSEKKTSGFAVGFGFLLGNVLFLILIVIRLLVILVGYKKKKKEET